MSHFQESEGKTTGDRQCVCVCVCVCARYAAVLFIDSIYDGKHPRLNTAEVFRTNNLHVDK